jgi:hypothetical protein
MLVGIPRFEIAPIHPRLSILWAIVYPLHNCRHQGIETNYPAGAENAPFTFPDRWRFYSQIQQRITYDRQEQRHAHHH